jgi:Na+-transporting NADH:ubiquinone oxidoreductase subunit C
MSETSKNKGFFGKLLALPNDDPKKTIFVAIALCLVCSVLVSTAAVALKPMQQANKAADIKKNILAVTGLLADDTDVTAEFEKFDVKLFDFETSTFSDMDPSTYDQRKAAGDPALGVSLTGEQDIAGIGRRAKLAPVYILKKGDDIEQIVLPVHGYGLWSTMYGFISLESDFNTISGLQFYEHAETPGLGGEITNPKWVKSWKGKQLFDEQGQLEIQVIRGTVDYSLAEAKHQVDGLSGATLTSQGVTNLLQYWLGDHAFGPYLEKMRSASR